MITPNNHPTVMKIGEILETSESTPPNSPNSKVQTAWTTVKTNFKDVGCHSHEPLSQNPRRIFQQRSDVGLRMKGRVSSATHY